MWIAKKCWTTGSRRRLELLTTRPPGEISPRRWIFKGSRVVGFWPSHCRTTSSTEKKGSTKDSIEGMPRGSDKCYRSPDPASSPKWQMANGRLKTADGEADDCKFEISHLKGTGREPGADLTAIRTLRSGIEVLHCYKKVPPEPRYISV